MCFWKFVQMKALVPQAVQASQSQTRRARPHGSKVRSYPALNGSHNKRCLIRFQGMIPFSPKIYWMREKNTFTLFKKIPCSVNLRNNFFGDVENSLLYTHQKETKGFWVNCGLYGKQIQFRWKKKMALLDFTSVHCVCVTRVSQCPETQLWGTQRALVTPAALLLGSEIALLRKCMSFLGLDV